MVEIERSAVRLLENNEIVPYRGGVLPIVRLSSLFGLAPRDGRAMHVFVIGTGLAAMQARPITDPLIKVEGVTGATDLGDGKVVLILDAARVARAAGTARGARRK